MEHKPWPLLILAFFHFIEPLSKIAFYSVYYHVNPVDVAIIEYQAGSARHAFEYFLLFPIAGIAIFAVKKWSFPVFIGVELWSFAANIPYLTELYNSNQFLLFSYFIFFAILNVSVVSYLLIPAVRIAYLDPRIRWWEAKPRYTVNLEATIDNDITGTIKNISESGVFLTTQNDLTMDSDIELTFNFNSPTDASETVTISVPASIIHKFTIVGHEGYGIRYHKLNAANKRLIHNMMKSLQKSDTERRPPRRNFHDLLNWVNTLIKTGKGLFPSNIKGH